MIESEADKSQILKLNQYISINGNEPKNLYNI